MLKLLAIGHLGRDAVVNNANGKTVINFSVAHTEKYKDAQGVQIDKTTWVECGYWSDRTAIVPYLKKGTQVYVEGTPEVRSYTTPDGRSGTSLSLRVQNIQLVGGKTEGGSEGGAPSTGSYGGAAPQAPAATYQQPTQTYQQPAASITEPADDLPF